MMSLMVLAICSLPPLAIVLVAATGLCTGQYPVALPLLVSAGVLLLPLLAPVVRADGPALSLRFVSQTQATATYASMHTAQ
jgi:hypothetical protein